MSCWLSEQALDWIESVHRAGSDGSLHIKFRDDSTAVIFRDGTYVAHPRNTPKYKFSKSCGPVEESLIGELKKANRSLSRISQQVARL